MTTGIRTINQTKTCPVDGILLTRHAECSACHILLGLGHEEKDTHWRAKRIGDVVVNRPLCSDCAGRFDRGFNVWAKDTSTEAS